MVQLLGAEKELQAQEEVIKYGFLLEKELFRAIVKGNNKWLDLARAKIDFLKDKIKPELLEEGVKGEEEALCTIYSFLHNEGWWEKACNLKVNNLGIMIEKSQSSIAKEEDELINFIVANKNFVHPNILKTIHMRDNENLRMALNQIHYGSLKTVREVRESKALKREA